MACSVRGFKQSAETHGGRDARSTSGARALDSALAGGVITYMANGAQKVAMAAGFHVANDY
jgi:hypothetical protein